MGRGDRERERPTYRELELKNIFGEIRKGSSVMSRHALLNEGHAWMQKVLSNIGTATNAPYVYCSPITSSADLSASLG